jgi:hypothetical protein
LIQSIPQGDPADSYSAALTGNGQWYEVPHMSTRKPRLQLEKFAINGPKRLLQQNLPGTDMRLLSDSQVGGPPDERKRRYQSDR